MRTKLERLEPLLFRTQLLGYEGERSGQNHWTDMPQGTAYSRADISGNGRLACEPEFNYTGCEQSRSEMERWTRTTQRTRNESCVRLGKRTPFLRLRAQLPRMADSQ